MSRTSVFGALLFLILCNLFVFVFFFRKDPFLENHGCSIDSRKRFVEEKVVFVSTTESKPELKSEKMVGFLQMATGKYSHVFIKRSHQSFLDFMFVGNDDYDFRTVYFTDQEEMMNLPKAVYIHQPKLEWPHDSMSRNDVYLNNRHILEGFDYLIALDMDMAWRKEITPDMLVNDFITLRHLAFREKGRGAYETRESCQAFTPKYAKGECYYVMGGFFGGTKDRFFDAINTMQKWRKIDKENEIVPIWHDESYVNRYVCENYEVGQEGVTFLGLNFFRGESDPLTNETYILHLNKNHNQIRN